jgi:threonine synthase
VTVGVLQKLIKNGLLDPAAETVVLNTGDGLKTLDAVEPTTGLSATIRPTLDSFREAGLA